MDQPQENVSVELDEGGWRDSVIVAPGIMLPKNFRIIVSSPTYVALLTAQGTPHGAIPTRLTLDPIPPGVVSSELIRSVAVSRIMSLATKKAIWVPGPTGAPIFGTVERIPAEALAQWPAGDLAPFLRHVATIYLVANAIGEGPTAAVAAATNVSRATAGRMVDAARRLGTLPPVPQGSQSELLTQAFAEIMKDETPDERAERRRAKLREEQLEPHYHIEELMGEGNGVDSEEA